MKASHFWGIGSSKAPAHAALAGPFFSLFRTILILGGAVFCISHPAGNLRAGVQNSPDGLPNFPRLILWAWERPEDLRFLNQPDQDRRGENRHQTGVAFLARTLYLRAGDVVVRPRFQPLRVSPDTPLMAVVRIEPQRDGRLKLSEEQAKRTAEHIAEVARLPQVTALQVDFDAVRSEREFYRQMLTHLRQQAPPRMPISITALASWCMDDDWITGLPVDEAVPMLFRMGVDHRNVIAFLSRNNEFNTSLCRQSLGISTDEPLSNLPKGKRVYIFTDKSWDKASLQAARQEIASIRRD
ncbi:MAG TPA: DUF3142 domain-containing protein [Candidatus Angelobacter sp.]|nr:DUF3142 domain-containing protein [Candidatus Angelobacter sp.]